MGSLDWVSPPLSSRVLHQHLTQLWLNGPHNSLPTPVTLLPWFHPNLLPPMPVLSQLRPLFTSSQDSTTPTPVPPTLVISSDSGSSSPLFFSSPGPSPSPSLDTLRVPSSGRDMRPWRPLVRPSPSSKDTNTLPSDASSESVPGSPDFPSVTPPKSSSDSSTTTTPRPNLRPETRTQVTMMPMVPPLSTTLDSTSSPFFSPT